MVMSPKRWRGIARTGWRDTLILLWSLNKLSSKSLKVIRKSLWSWLKLKQLLMYYYNFFDKKTAWFCIKWAFQKLNMGTIWVLFERVLNFFTIKELFFVDKKKESTLLSVDSMVDDTRLELVTSRTSSGCATSCANRPSLKACSL